MGARRRREPARRFLPLFVLYFALLGTGYMLIEVALIQKFMLFLGHPTFGVSMVLFCLLTGSGAGSYISRSWNDRLPVRASLVASGVAALVLAFMPSLNAVFAATLHLERSLHFLIAVALVFPLGFLMGIPFPVGIRMLKETRPADIAWIWGINGLLSVVGSILAMIGGKAVGFTNVFLLGASAYLLVALLGFALARGNMPSRSTAL